MFMRSDLKERMIPHRTKLRSMVLKIWRNYFKSLRDELGVSILIIEYLAFTYFLGCDGPDILYSGHLV